jgi:hypothetical protein
LWEFWDQEKKPDLNPQSISLEELKKLLYCMNLFAARWEEGFLLTQVQNAQVLNDSSDKYICHPNVVAVQTAAQQKKLTIYCKSYANIDMLEEENDNDDEDEDD